MKKIFTLIAAAMMAVCANAQTLFSMEIDQTIGSAVKVDGDDQINVSDYGTVSGAAKCWIYNGHADAKDMIRIASGQVYVDLGGSGKSNIFVRLEKPLQAGDKLVITTVNNKEVEITAEKASGADNTVAQSFTFTSAFDGKTDFYIYRGSSKGQIKTVKVVREANKVKMPEFAVKGSKLTITSATDGAKIYYSTASGVTAATGTLYSAPITVNETSTYYAIAVKDGMDTSDEASQKIVIPYGTLAATMLAEKVLSGDVDDEALTSLTVNGFTLTPGTGAVLSNTSNTGTSITFKFAIPRHLKLNKTLTLTAPEGKTITSIKVFGIQNGSNTSTVTVSNMECTSGTNLLPSRDDATEMHEVGFAIIGEAKQSFDINFSAQARAYMEIYTGTVTGINNITAAPSAKVVKAVENGQLVIKSAKGTFSVAGARIK